MEGTSSATSTARQSPSFRNAPRDSGRSGTWGRGCATATPAAPPPAGGARARLKGAVGGGRPQCGAGRPGRGRGEIGAGRGAAGTAQSAQTGTNGGTRRWRLRSRNPAPTDQPPPPAQPAAQPGLPMAPEAGAPPCARRLLPWAALLLLAALVPAVSAAGAPGTRSRGWAARLCAPPPASLSARLSRWDRRPAPCWLRVVSLTCASSSLAGQGAKGRMGTRDLGTRSPRAGGGSGDAVGARGPRFHP